MALEPIALVVIALLLAAWTIAAGAAIVNARGRQRRADAMQRNARRLARMIDESPAIPLLVRTDGRIEASQRLAHWLGLERVPEYLSELDAGDKGLLAETLTELNAHVLRTQKTAVPFRMVATPRGSSRSLAFRGIWPIRKSRPAARRWCGCSISATVKANSSRCAKRRSRRREISMRWSR